MEQPVDLAHHGDLVLCASSRSQYPSHHAHPPVVTERLEPSLSHPPVAISNLVEIFGPVGSSLAATVRSSLVPRAISVLLSHGPAIDRRRD